MTVLRSRKIIPTKTTPKTPTTKRLRSIEPSTPAQKHEPPSSTLPTPYTPSSPSINPDPFSNPTAIPVGLGSDSVSVSGVTKRRSLRLAFRVEPGERTASNLMEGGRSRRKSGSGENGAVSTAEKEKARSANGEASFYLMGKKVSVGIDEEGIQKLEMDSSADPVAELSGKGSGLGGEEKVDVKEEEGLRDSKGKRKLNIDINLPAASESCEDDDEGVLNLRSGKRVAKRRIGRALEKEEDVVEDKGEIGKKKLVDDLRASESFEGEDGGVLNLRSGKRVSKKRMGRVVEKEDHVLEDKGEIGKKKLVEEDGAAAAAAVELDLELELKTNSSFSIQEAEASSRRKGKRKMNGENEQVIIIGTEIPQEVAFGIQNLIHPEEAAIAYRNLIDTIEVEAQKGKEKGKEKLEENYFITISDDDELDLELGLGFESEIEKSVDFMVKSAVNLAVADNVALDERRVGQTSSSSNAARKGLGMERYREREGLATERYREIADTFVKEKVVEKKAERRVENHLAAEVEVGAKQDVEDWPGPFRTAMKIIRDRANKFVPVEDSSFENKSKLSKPRPVIWTPKKKQDQDRVKRLVPSLLELCVMGLAKNADAIASLQFVPDALRHWLSSIICGSRTMSTHFLKLLLHGSPTEIRIKDCSWLTEEQFANSLQGFDPSNLTVLRLDLCGRCLPDYVVLATLARSSNNMPALTTLSLTGACRLSDVGLDALVSSAPALRYINLSQCSFLTPSSINSLANSLGSSLRELYLDDCQSIDPMLTLPAFKRLEQLEVLSLAGIENVCDDFVTQFIRDCGNNMKKLVLAGCVNLTDSSLKVIAETCSQLSTIDLMKLWKLTDSALGYLANGCQTIQTLKLCRNQFSDEGVAAFLQSSGDHLKELWLNNVKKVGYNTALSLARRSSRLHTLDLSWCRNLTDEALGLIVDNCLSIRLLKLFGCTQITNVFLDGHSNPDVKIVGLPMSKVLEDIMVPDPLGELHYFSLPSST